MTEYEGKVLFNYRIWITPLLPLRRSGIQSPVLCEKGKRGSVTRQHSLCGSGTGERMRGRQEFWTDLTFLSQGRFCWSHLSAGESKAPNDPAEAKGWRQQQFPQGWLWERARTPWFTSLSVFLGIHHLPGSGSAPHKTHTDEDEGVLLGSQRRPFI